MDGLSAAASVIAVVDIALKLGETCQRYYMGVKNARRDIQRVRNSLESLTDILQNIQTVVEEGKHPSLASLSSPLQQCGNDLTIASKKLQPSKHSVLQALKWPFNEKDVSKLVYDIEKHKANLNLALTTSTIFIVSAASEDLEQFRKELQLAQSDETRITILAWFSTVDPSSNHLKARERHEPTSGSWILKGGHSLEKWTEKPDSLLWLYGKAGCGKSVLCSTIIDHLFEQCEMKPSFAMAYYYFDFSDARKQNVRNMLNSLIAQICHQRRELPEAVTNFYRQYYDGRMVPSIADLVNLLAYSTEGFMEVYFVLDALDECPLSGPAASRMEVLKTLKDIHDWRDQRTRLLVTSRNEVDIERALTPIITDGPLDVREFIDEDIKLYIRNELSSPKFQHWSPGIATDVEESLVNRADGMFRWVALQLAELQNLSQKRRILKALENLPATLEETYDRILRNIDSPTREQAITALHWMSFSSRPLSFDEFAELMALNGQDDPVLDIEDRFSNPNEALRFLPGLITSSINKDKGEIVTFSHFTVREYLLSGPMSIGNLTYTFEEKVANETIAELCFRYMIQIMDVSKSWGQLESEYPLFYYAASYSFAHASKSLNESLTSLIMDFTVPGSKWWESWTQVFGIDSKGNVIVERRDAVPASPLYYTACFGLTTIVKAIAARDGNINDDVGFYGTPLQAAARFKREDVVKYLLEQGADPNHHSGFDRSALHAAVLQWNETIVDILLDHGADITWDRQAGETSDPDDALRVAVGQASKSMVQKLLTRGEGDFSQAAYKSLFLNAARWGDVGLMNLVMTEPDFNAHFRNEWTPGALMKATKGDKKEIITSLLKKTEEMHAIDGDSASLIRLAFEKGKAYILGLLLEERVLHEEKDLCGRFILQLVTGEGYPNPLEFFLVGTTTSGGDTVQEISITAQYQRLVKLILDRERAKKSTGNPSPPVDHPSHEDLVRKILTYRPNVNVVDKSGSTALHKIVRKPGTADLVTALLDAGANIEAAHGFTTLLLDATLANTEENLVILLDRGADVTATDSLGNTVLHSAASSGNEACMIPALNAGANIAKLNGSGLTVAELAKVRGHEELAQWLFSVQSGPTTEEIKFAVGSSTDEGNPPDAEADIRFLASEKARTRTF